MKFAHSVAFADSETLDLNPTNPHQVAVESLGAIRLSLEADGHKVEEVDLFRMYFDLLVSSQVRESIRTYVVNDYAPTMQPNAPEAFVSVAFEPDTGVRGTAELFDVRLSLIEQMGMFRNASPDTLAFHAKNGRNLDSFLRVALAPALAVFKSIINPAIVTFYRGTDFDGPLIASLYKDLEQKLPYRGGKHNLLRDVRTALDENLGSGYYGFMDSALAWEPVVARSFEAYVLDTDVSRIREMIKIARDVLSSLNSNRHSALIDSYCDAVQYCLTKHARLSGFTLRPA